MGGGNTACAITNLGAAYCWGRNDVGQIGDGTIVSKSSPVAVQGGRTFCQITSSLRGGFALNQNKQAYAWGSNQYLGINNGTGSSLSPVPVCCNFSYNHISAWQDHTCAVTTGGTAWCWGQSNSGELGQNQALAGIVISPVAVCGGHTFCKISVGLAHTCGLRNDGLIYCWGRNNEGQLGDNTTTNRSTPVAVCGGISFCDVVCGYTKTVALKSDGLYYAWGDNTNGGLGITDWANYSPNLISSI